MEIFNNMNSLNCFLCEQLAPDGINGLGQHFSTVHNILLNRRIDGTGFVCAQNGCQRNFEYFYNLRKHLRNIHLANEGIFEIPFNNVVDFPENEVENNSVDSDDDLLDDQNLEEPGIQNNDRGNFDIRSHIINMLARFQACPSMTGSMMKAQLEESEELLSNAYQLLKRKINAEIKVGEVLTENTFQNINRILDFQAHANNPFCNLKTFEQQIVALKENFNYIEPQKMPLGYRLDSVFDKDSCTFVQKQVMESFQYVSITDTLKLVLSNLAVRHAIVEEQASANGMLNSFIDGQNFKSNPFFQRHKNAIRIKLYYDELEVVNGMGSKTGVHKLGAFYFQISNLPPSMNSELDSIHTLLLCCHADVVKYGFKKILHPFLSELQKLESDEGIQLNFDNEVFILRATLESLCGDGLAVHEVFNLLGPSANRFCRLCLYTRDDLRSGSNEKCDERTKQLFETHLNFLRCNNFSDAAKTATGLRGYCCLNDLLHFHIARNKIFDIMHDFLCGLVPMLIKLVLYQYIIVQRLFDTTYLNAMISTFNYGYTEKKNKPSANFTETMLRKNDHSISQTAMQSWCLIRVLPFLLSAKVAADDEHMRLIVHLLRIMEIVFSPRLSSSLLPYVSELTKDYFQEFKRLFPDVNLINKFHHVDHYAECIEWSGPLILYWCMRFEANHSEVKLRAENIHNFKNPPKTLIRISKSTQCLKWGAGNAKINSLNVTSGTTCFVRHTSSRQYLLYLGYAEDTEIFVSTYLEVNGIEFRKKLFVGLEKAAGRDANLLLFGQIEEIIVLTNNEVFLLTSVCETNYFDTDLNAYNIEIGSLGGQLNFVRVSSLPFYKTLSYWTKPTTNDLYISLRHIIL